MVFSIILIVFLIATLVFVVITRMAANRLMCNHHDQKRDFFRRHPIQPGDIVFLGDSLTDGARWDELFPGKPVKNRGINGDTTHGVLQRLDDILAGKPAVVFLLIGTNDLAWYSRDEDSNVVKNYRAILDRCRKESPETLVYVQSLLPRARHYAVTIQCLNKELQGLANQFGYTYIDLYPHFAGERGELRPELTNDNIHILGAGYDIWVQNIKLYI